MFTMTGIAHFVGMRDELIMMVPPALPAPDALVTLTGILELAGAAGLLVRRTAPWAAAGLTALLIAVFPANVYAAVEGIATEAHQALLPRTVMQLVFLAATVAVYLAPARSGGRSSWLCGRRFDGGPAAASTPVPEGVEAAGFVVWGTALRQRGLPCRAALRELTRSLIYAATSEAPLAGFDVRTPVATAHG